MDKQMLDQAERLPSTQQWVGKRASAARSNSPEVELSTCSTKSSNYKLYVKDS